MALSSLFNDPYANLFDFTPFTVYAPSRQPTSGAGRQSQQQSLWAPMDVEESDDRYEILADVPGMSPEDISVEYNDAQQVLTIRGEHVDRRGGKEGDRGFFRTERARRAFARAFTLPNDAEGDKICACIENGILKVDVPKKPTQPQVQAPSRKIPIQHHHHHGARAHIGGAGLETGGATGREARIGASEGIHDQGVAAGPGGGGVAAPTYFKPDTGAETAQIRPQMGGGETEVGLPQAGGIGTQTKTGTVSGQAGPGTQTAPVGGQAIGSPHAAIVEGTMGAIPAATHHPGVAHEAAGPTAAGPEAKVSPSAAQGQAAATGAGAQGGQAGASTGAASGTSAAGREGAGSHGGHESSSSGGGVGAMLGKTLAHIVGHGKKPSQ